MRRACNRCNWVTGDPGQWICPHCGGNEWRLLPEAGEAVAMFHPHILETGKGIFWVSVGTGLLLGAAFWTAVVLILTSGHPE